MSPLKYNIHEVCLTASGGSYQVIYTAEVETTEGSNEVTVEMVSLQPQSETYYVQQAIDIVRQAAAEVLSPYGLGAVIRLHDFVIHPVDFNPHSLRRYTLQYLAAAIEQCD